MLRDRLVQLRKEQNKTQADMARILGITRPAYTAYEKGSRNPDYETLAKLADFFECTTDYLLARSNSRNMTKEDEETAERYGLNELPDQERMFFKDWEKYTKEEIEEAREWIEFKRQQRKKNDER